jgi:hypothetical protein
MLAPFDRRWMYFLFVRSVPLDRIYPPTFWLAFHELVGVLNLV